MVLTGRLLNKGGEESSGLRKREFKRRYGNPSLFGTVSRISSQELGSILEPFVRNCVKEEVEDAIKTYVRNSLNLTNPTGSRICQLHFEKKLPSTIFTGCKVLTEDKSPVRIVLQDVSTGNTITWGPLSSARLSLSVLDGDLNPEDDEDVIEEEFKKKILREREGKRPLMTGTLSLTLREGVACVEDISFTDNSRWLRSGMFRLGVKLQNNTSGIGVKEGISSAFKVKDQRGELYKKNHPPSLVDEVWRLEKIAKDGVLHKRLANYGIFTVQDFMRLYNTNPSVLRCILGKKINKSWDTIVGHAQECCLQNDELYVYRTEHGIGFILNSIYQVVGMILDGQNYLPLDELTQSQKLLVENLKHQIYRNLNDLVPIGGGQSFFTSPLPSSSSQACYFSAPDVMLQTVSYAAKQDELEMQMNSNSTIISSIQSQGLEDKIEYLVSMAETASQIEGSNATFGDEFVLDDASSYGIPTLGNGWETAFSMEPLGPTVPW